MDEYIAGNSKTIEGIKKLSEFEVSITLKQPYVPFPKILALPQMCILPSKLLSKNPKMFFSKPVGNGPYKIIRKDSKALLLEAFFTNELYIPKVKYYKFISIFNKNRQVKKGYSNQQFDLTIHPDAKFFRQPLHLEFRTNSTFNMVFLCFNCERYPTNQIDVRQSFFYAIDHQKILNDKEKNVTPADFISPIFLLQDTLGKKIIYKEYYFFFLNLSDIVKSFFKLS